MPSAASGLVASVQIAFVDNFDMGCQQFFAKNLVDYFYSFHMMFHVKGDRSLRTRQVSLCLILSLINIVEIVHGIGEGFVNLLLVRVYRFGAAILANRHIVG